MKTRLAMLLLALLPPAPAIRAQDQPPVIAVSLASTPLSAYGGGPMTFALGVQAPFGTHLRVYADLVQVMGGSLAAPLLRHVAVSPELVFDRRTATVVTCALPALPAVRSKTRFSLNLRTEPAGPDGPLTVPLFVYPAEDLGAWKESLTDRLPERGLRRLAVFGGSQGPRAFLRERDIAFDDLGVDWPAEPDRRTLYLAEITVCQDTADPLLIPRQFAELPGVRLLLFAPNIAGALPQGVYQTADAAGGSIWKVTIPGLFGNPGSHPQNLELLRLLFDHALSSVPLGIEQRH